MLRPSLRVTPSSRQLATIRPLRATPHRSPWQLHPSSSRRLGTFLRPRTRLAGLFRSRDPSFQQAKPPHHPLQASTRHKSPEDHSGVRGLISHIVHEVLSHPTRMFCAVCILVVGLGAHALAAEVERIKREFTEGVKNLWRGVKILPGRSVEGVKAVSRKGGSRMKEMKEVVIGKGERVVERGREWRVKRAEEVGRGKDGVYKALEGTWGKVNRIFRRDVGKGGEGSKGMEKLEGRQDGVSDTLRNGSGKGTGNSKVKTEEWLREKQKRIKSKREGP